MYFKLYTKKGKLNFVEDSLSRKEQGTKSLLSIIYIIQVGWILEAIIEWKHE